MYLNAISVDVEDYFHSTTFENIITTDSWDQIRPRVIENTYKILNILSKFEVRATFFVLGWVAERYPALVKAIAEEGHEIGSHGYFHKRIYLQTPDEFREDLKKSLYVIAEITGELPKTYRAPTFSIIEKSLWALDIMLEEGIICDSSVFPIRHDSYGYTKSPLYPHEIRPGLWEFPLTSLYFGGQNIPVGGGGYFRLYPYWITNLMFKKINALNRPCLVYLHPWEIDSDQPRFKMHLIGRFRHYQNLGKTESRLRKLLKDYKFAPIKEVLEIWKSKIPE